MSPCHPVSIGGSGSPSCHWNLGTEIPAESILGENCVQSVNRRHELTLVQVSESFWTGVRHARACLASRERGWLPRSRSMALRPLFLPPAPPLSSAACGTRSLPGAPGPAAFSAGSGPGRSAPVCARCGTHGRATPCPERGCSAFGSCGASLPAGFAAGTPVREADGSRGFVGGKVSPNTASAATSLVLQSGRCCNMENYHHGSPLCKRALGSRGSRL